jgi:hypothetical protein
MKLLRNLMNAITIRNTNRFWQECQRSVFAQMNDKQEHEIDPSPQAGGSEA